MKKIWLTTSLLGITLCFIAWLFGLLLADSWLSDDYLPEHESVIEDLARILEQPQELENTLPELAEEFSVSLRIIKPQIDQAQTPDTEETSEVAFDIYDIELANGEVVEVGFSATEPGFFTTAELIQLFLQCLALLTSVCVFYYWSRSFLTKEKEALEQVLATLPSNQFRANKYSVETRAMAALQNAETKIASLTDAISTAKIDAANDHRDLLASVAHEFRNPLARLQFANEMAMDRTGEEQSALFEEANQAAFELDDLVRETLSYSRLSGESDIQSTREQVSITDLFREIAASPQFANTDKNLQIRYPEHDAFIFANKKLLIRALGNLVGNGLRYAENVVTLAANVDDKKLVMTVTDDGPGIEAHHHARIFEPFYRVERSRSRETGGFGLGLSIVKSIIEKHGATVSIAKKSNESSSDVGAQFDITFDMEDDINGI